MIPIRLRASLHPSTLAAVLVLSLSTGSAQAQLQFGPATELVLPGVVDMLGPSLSSDGLTLYFSSASSGGEGDRDIWTATRSTRFGSFGPVVNVGPGVNSSSREGGPSISLDGLSFFFNSNRPGGLGDNEVYVATRATTNDVFGTPISLGAGVNSSSADGNPAISAEGLTLVFSSDRPGGFGGSDQADNYIATRPNTSAPFGAAANLGPTINRFVGHGSPSLSADSLRLFFAGWDGGTNTDLYVSTRASLNGPWGDPVSLGPNVNSTSFEDFGEFARDGKSIVFISDRSGVDRLYEAAVVPEPSTLALVTCGGLLLAVLAAHRRAEKRTRIRAGLLPY